MSRARAANDSNVFAFEVYTAARNLLPREYDERCNIASIVMHMVIYGDNVDLIAEKMQRSKPWVYERLETARNVFDPD